MFGNLLRECSVLKTLSLTVQDDLVKLFRARKINPMAGAAGISAVPMSSRVVQKIAQEENPANIILMYAAGANVSGQIVSVAARA